MGSGSGSGWGSGSGSGVVMADCILRGKEVREDVEALRAGYTEMRYCFGEDDVVSALNDLAKKSGI